MPIPPVTIGERCRRTSPRNLDVTKPRLSVEVATADSKVFSSTGPLGLPRLCHEAKAQGRTRRPLAPEKGLASHLHSARCSSINERPFNERSTPVAPPPCCAPHQRCISYPRSICTPAAYAPPQEMRPAAAAPKPSMNHQLNRKEP